MRAVAAALAACVALTAVAALGLAGRGDAPPLGPRSEPPFAAHPPIPGSERVEARVATDDGAGAGGPSACPPVAGPVRADLDGDGCPDALRVDGHRVHGGGTTWVVGHEGDEVVVGDWACDGSATAALLRPATGEVFVFDRWAGPGDEVTVAPAARREGAVGLRVDRSGDGCPTLLVVGPDGSAEGVAAP